MSNQKEDKTDSLKEIMSKIEFVQSSIGELQNKLKDVIIYLEDASSTETTESAVSKKEDSDIKREL